MSLSIEAIAAFLYAEARAQSEKRWADWLDFYAEDAVFHMPSWDDDDRLTTDPKTEVSLMYYPNRNGLEDRVFRIETERSSATIPDTRFNRAITNIEVLSRSERAVEVCFFWTTHAFRYSAVDVYFGTATYTIDVSGPKPKIKKKYVVLKNDYVHHVLDVYYI
ncbi:benzoate/toluate 1,2-dioxygenase beta subunit [Roseiarcus fermentans]|uniref:Benzoate/toluate 1,2-dioxygenase beta subunit n=1 Tax=Roseiarcus fermentans TaxID=1473586 RepID=A0A366EM42_9HYPH|nr:benzoate 1,2-dioxygenase small subunit [Roseiarcus fermentans]RBP03056.1 benzoate/toluate 1,2-dioxygenase beta subunit [Roseiarcus fermentans]